MDHKLVIGKYTLESLTNGMYASPLDLYREYIQNAVDSFDQTISLGIAKKEELCIDISIDGAKRTLKIYDNGCGISSSVAIATLIDIGNSSKHRISNRGFRGIGRLAGLGYCEELLFITSAVGEDKKTLVRFNAKLLKEQLLSTNDSNVSVSDVMSQIISIELLPEKINKHYFEVSLISVSTSDGLLDTACVQDYLIQHAPLPFDKDLKWKSTIIEKVKIAGYEIPDYNIRLNGENLFKPYKNSFVSDRVKKIDDYIQDIQVMPIYRNDTLTAVLWYAQTSYYGTINENSIKGIRIRQGNILVGDKTSCNEFFKEERFNGWILGELHVVDPELIANSRRDNFEKNEVYYSLVESFKEWAFTVSKDIRKISYERSLNREKKALIDAKSFEDVNDLCTEDLSYAESYTESDFLDSGESDDIAEADYFGKLSVFLGQKKNQTKYKALNINSKLTFEQRKTLERVFDLIQQDYLPEESEKFINNIARKF